MVSTSPLVRSLVMTNFKICLGMPLFRVAAAWLVLRVRPRKSQSLRLVLLSLGIWLQPEAADQGWEVEVTVAEGGTE
jgi:hypothetical protein